MALERATLSLKAEENLPPPPITCFSNAVRNVNKSEKENLQISKELHEALKHIHLRMS